MDIDYISYIKHAEYKGMKTYKKVTSAIIFQAYIFHIIINPAC